MPKINVVRLVVAFLTFSTNTQLVAAQEDKRPFTVADDIELSQLLPDTPNVRFSPDGQYFAVYSERGHLDLNTVEDSLRFYRSHEIEKFLAHSEESSFPTPKWVVNRSNNEGPVIQEWRWLADSSGVAFLETRADGKQQLILADIANQRVEPLTSDTENVAMFDVRDRTHYVYTAADPLESEKALREKRAELGAPSIVGTGRGLNELLYPPDFTTSKGIGVQSLLPSGRRYLWAVIGNRRFEVKHEGVPLVPKEQPVEQDLALAPDGRTVATALRVSEVPSSWESLYPPPSVSSIYGIHAGKDAANQYVRIDIESGSIRPLTDAPTSLDAGWIAYGGPEWSSDGQEILLPATFIQSKDGAPSRPCVAIVNISSNTRTCIEILESVGSGGHTTVKGASFAKGDKQRVLVSFWKENAPTGTTEYRRSAQGWAMVRQFKEEDGDIAENGLHITVRQSINAPPLLVASLNDKSRVIWDPNPQLRNIELGEVSVYTWRDENGREQKGGLYKPFNYKAGERYPLVIQTHGFLEEGFRPSGTGFGPAYAALALAARGIIVLQLGEDCPDETPSEGPCAAAVYETAASQLVTDGLVDRDRIGIIGFSRTCFYVMQALTTDSSLHLKAASITDGVMETYFQYILDPERSWHETNAIIGAAPFGDGLHQWLKRSPGFNLDKVKTPLLVNAAGFGPAVLEMWEPYAGLHYLHKPVDLIILNTDEHTLTNPAARMASQGGSVDWFRFWLQDYEDPDPAKAEQYKRWHDLKKMQSENEHASSAKAQAN